MKRVALRAFLVIAGSALVFAGGGTQQKQSGPAPAASTGGGPVSYPLPGNKTLSINQEALDPATIPAWVGDNYFWTQAAIRTGVKLNRVGGASNAMNNSEQFTLLLASLDYPDLMLANWLEFPGGPNQAINDGYIIPLNDYLRFAPNFVAALEREPQIKRDISTDEGTIYNIPFYTADTQFTGPVIRQDWLDELGLSAPVTIDDWYTTLKAFKEKKNASAPLSFEYRWFFVQYSAACLSSPWGVTYPFYIADDGKTVKFGPMEPGYREFLTEMRKWYAEGLIDRDMPSINKATVDAKFASGNAGVVIEQAANVENAANANKDNPAYKIAGLQTPVLKAGDKRNFGHYVNAYNGSFCTAISSQCKDIETALRYLDYFWSPEGQRFASYGTEGVSYTMVDGKITLNTALLDHLDTNTPLALRAMFACGQNGTNFSYRSIDPDWSNSPLVGAVKTFWRDNDMLKHIYPPVTATPDEASYVSSTFSNIDTYCQEMIVKFIIGNEPLSNYDAFIARLKSLGVEKLVQYKQAAYDRYLKR